MTEQKLATAVLRPVRNAGPDMNEEHERQWTVGETVRLKDDLRLMTVVKNHDDGSISVAWFEQRKMHLERVPAENVLAVENEVLPPGRGIEERR